MTPHLNAALAALQGELPTFGDDAQREVTVEHKDGTSHSYKYVTLNTIMAVVGPLMAKHGLSFAALPGYNDTGDGKIMLALRYRLAHESGEEITGLFPLPGGDGQGSQGQRIQAMGSAISYARRYCLASVLGIAAEHDDDGQAAEDLANSESAPRTAARRARTDQSARNLAAKREAAAAGPDSRPTAQRRTSGDNPGDDTSASERKRYSPPRDPNAPISTGQAQRLAILFGELGFHQKEVRIRLTGMLAGREVASSKDLTAGEGHEIMEMIDSAMDAAKGNRDEAIRILKDAAADVAARRAASTEEAPPDAEEKWASELAEAREQTGRAE